MHEATPVKNVTPIAVAVVEQNGRYLIGERPTGVVLAGFAEFPGGKVHAEETLAQAAGRECREETGIEVEVRELIAETVHAYEHGPVHLHFFRCRPVHAAMQPRPPFRWVDRGQLDRFRFPPANDELLRLLRDASTAV